MTVIHYTKAQYQAKITQLEGLHQQLSSHLTRMEELREQIYAFWKDENARKAWNLLNIRINSVRSAMDRTFDLLTFYKSAVDKLDGAGGVVSELLDMIKK